MNRSARRIGRGVIGRLMPKPIDPAAEDELARQALGALAGGDCAKGGNLSSNGNGNCRAKSRSQRQRSR